MTDYDRMATAIRQANPWAEGGTAAEGEWSTDELLSQIEHRSSSMDTMEGKTTLRPTPGSRGNRQRNLLMAAAALAVVVATGAVAAVILSGDDSTDVAGRPDLTPVEIAELAWGSLEAGDADGFRALLGPDLEIVDSTGAELSPFDTPVGLAEHLALELYGSAVDLNTACTATGNVAKCEYAPVSPLGVKDESGQPTLAMTAFASFTIEDGLIVRWERTESGADYDQRRKADYEAWLEANYPEDHAELFARGSMVFDDFDGAARHRAFVQEWAASQ